MGEISFTWELGENPDYLTGVVPLQQRLRGLGHRSHLILRDLSRLHQVIDEDVPAALQAPLWLPELINPPPVQSYADILLCAGYADTQGLRAMIDAWIRLFELQQTALVVADRSPTALLAARIMQLPCVTWGNGFGTPPRLVPLPPLSWWNESEKAEPLQAREELVLTHINYVLDLYSAPPLAVLSDLFAVDETFLRTFAELDHYPQRAILQSPKPVYLGPDLPADGDAQPVWPDASGPRVFAHLSAAWPGLEDLLKTFRTLPISVLAQVSALTPAQQKAYSADNLRVTSEVQQLAAVREQCEFAVCHGDLAMVSAMLAGGRPLLLAPLRTEQVITCRNVERLRAGLTLRADTRRHPPGKLLKYLLDEPGFLQQAKAFAESYADYAPSATNDAIAARCNEILLGANVRATA